MKKASLSDIARACGVSKTLVSLVLNGKGATVGINKETERRVVKKAEELDYKPSSSSRSTRVEKSNTIGLVISDISNPFYARICRSAEDYAAKNGYSLFICSSDETVTKELHLIQMLIDRSVEGLIISTSQESVKEFSRLKRIKIPFVLIDRHFPKYDAHSVTVNNYQGAFDATQHLINLGHSRIAHFTISPSHLPTIKDRTKGYKDALRAKGIRYDKDLVKEIPFYNIKARVKKELKELFKSSKHASAIFVANNNIAKAVLESMNELHMRMPHDLALVSFDDIDLFKLCYPPITAVSQPIDEIGRVATETLINILKNKDKGTTDWKQIVLDTDLVVRRSCGSFVDRM